MKFNEPKLILKGDNKMTYIMLLPDKKLMVGGIHYPEKKDYPKGARFFRVKDNVDICCLSVWKDFDFVHENFEEIIGR